MNSYIRDVENNIKNAIDESRRSKHSAEDAKNTSYYGTMNSEINYARRYANDAYYYANNAINKLSSLITTYNGEVSKLVKEINLIINEINEKNEELVLAENEFNKNQIIAEIREIDIQAGTDWYKEVGSKQAAPLRKKLNNLKSEKADHESNINENKYEARSNAFSNTESDLNRAKSYAYDAEKYANTASYERAPLPRTPLLRPA